MICKTNALKKKTSKEKLNLTLKTNQSSSEVLLGKTITISHVGGTSQYTWEGEKLIIDIPPYVKYNITLEDVEGYKTPELPTYTAQPNNSNQITAEYLAEKVTVNIEADDSASLNGQIITINGKSFTYSGTAVSTLVPYNTSYTISTNTKTYYIKPSNITRTASKESYSVTMKYKASKLTLSINSNQTNDSTISAVKATVTWSGSSKNVGNGQTIYIPTDKTVTITYPAVTGYTTPSSITVTNSSGGTITKSATYNTTVVTLNMTGLATGVSYPNATISYNSTSVANNGTIKIPYNTSVTVTFADVDGYTKPDSVTFSTGTSKTYTVTATYEEITIEIKIVGKNGTMYSYDNWSSSNGVTGLYINDGNHDFIMAIDEYAIPSIEAGGEQEVPSWGTDGLLLSEVTTTTKQSEAVLDFVGRSNTEAMIDQDADKAFGATYCLAYGRANKQAGQWYLPSAGEIYTININLAMIQPYLDKVGSSIDLESNSFWSSTQESSYRFWKSNEHSYTTIGDGDMAWEYKDAPTIISCHLLPVCSVQDITSDVAPGIYLVDDDGFRYPTNTDFIDDRKTYVALMCVSEDQVKFFVDIKYGTASTEIWADENPSFSQGYLDINNLPYYSNKTDALNDTACYYNTIYTQYGSMEDYIGDIYIYGGYGVIDNYIFGPYYNYVSGNSGIPGLGLWYRLYQYKDKVDELIATVGGKAIQDAYYWSSTSAYPVSQNNAVYFYQFHWGTGATKIAKCNTTGVNCLGFANMDEWEFY